MSKYCYCIDAGHASSTSGKRSPVLPDGKRLFEYEFNRAVQSELIELLKSTSIEYFIVTPERDLDVPLTTRAVRAYRYKSRLPKILISIHSNAHGMGDKFTEANGWEIYTTKGQTKSDKIATTIFNVFKAEFGAEFKFRTDTTDKDPDKEADFTIIKTAEKYGIMAVLIENFFYTNEKECKLLLDPMFRKRIAKAIYKSILQLEND